MPTRSGSHHAHGAAAAPLQSMKQLHKSKGPKKIKIRPYQTMPKLPEHYYEETAAAILEGTLAVLSQRLGLHSSRNSDNNKLLSLQNAYQNVQNLVSHNYGSRLYQDLVQSMTKASQIVLPPQNQQQASMTHSSSLLNYAVTQYHLFTEYLLLLKHICLPLDSTWQWQCNVVSNSANNNIGDNNINNGRAVPISSATTGGGGSTGNSSCKTLWHVGLAIFRHRLNELNMDETLYKVWFASFLEDWNSGSNSAMSTKTTTTTVERHHLQQVWYLWQDLGVLGQLSIQADLESYWQAKSDEWKQNSTCYRLQQFLQFCHDKHARCNVWRPWLPAAWLWNILDHCLVLPHLNSDYLLAEEHLHPVLEEQLFFATAPQSATSNPAATSNSSEAQASALSPIQQLWMLAGRVNGQDKVAQAIMAFAKKLGLQRVTQSNTTRQRQPGGAAVVAQTTLANTSSAVPELLELQDKLRVLLHSLSATSTNVGGAAVAIPLKNVWEDVCNVDTEPPLAEQLAKFLDVLLRSNKKMDQYQKQQQNSSNGSNDDYGWLQRIIAGLFVPIQAKDVFEAFYKRDLAKRLLWNRVVSMDAEKRVCSLLKAECGAGYTSKMEGMFQDVDWSREIMMVYKQSAAGMASKQMQQSAVADNNHNNSVEVEVQVLTTGYWPVYPQYPNLNLPDNLRIPQDQFAEHYKTKYQGRRMSWQYALGHCVVRANGFGKPYELLVSLCQALVLIQFETSKTALTLPHLLQVTGLEDRSEMERILQSLALGKDGTRILRKVDHDVEPGKKKKTRMNVDDRDKFVINGSFESNSRRIRIQNIMMKETREEREKTVEAVSRDRLYLIDAVLVRIMKARKTILHQALIPQVLEQVKVPAQPADVKKRIESLIEREYMERDAKDRNRYNYLA